MAESGGVSGILGGDAETPSEGAAQETPTPLDPTAAALAAEAAKSDPELAQEASAYFRKQSHLVEVQTEHLHEQRAVNLSLLKLKRIDERLKLGLRVFVILVATAIGVGAVLMVRDALTSRQVVVDPIDVSANVAARVPGGKIIASGLLDELSRLQDATRGSSNARGLTGAWAGNIKLEVPETGVSLGEISRLLKERFGHDVHIDGDLIEAPAGGLALTVRGTGVPPKTFSGGATDLGKLTLVAAEYIYSKSQPARWANYLTVNNRNDEAIAFCRAAVATAERLEQPRLMNSWALALLATGGSVREALGLHRAALKLQPDSWIVLGNIVNDLIALGDEEGAWKAGEEMRAVAGGRPGKARELDYQNWDYLTWNLKPWLDASLADAEANAGAGSGNILAGPAIADIHARLHDADAAELALKTSKEDPGDPGGTALIHHVRGRLAMEAGDIAKALTEMEAFGRAYADPAVSTNNPGYHCWIALTEEAAGRQDKADAFLTTAGTFVDCYRFRADILAGRGDWPGAQKAYAEAVALAPDLPAAYYSWGAALAKHGDFAGARTKLADANKRGPHWADPLKAWGDVFEKQGQTKAALAKYDEALKYAPNWKELKEVREALAKKKS